MRFASKINALIAFAGLTFVIFEPLAYGGTSVHIPARVHTPDGKFSLAGAQPKTLSIAQAAAADKTATHGRVSTNKNTLTFRQKSVRLVVRSGPANDMLSYRIAGLRNPTLVVSAGTTLKTLFLNTDDDMMHNLRFTAQKQPLPGRVQSAGTSNLPHKSDTVYYAEDLTMYLPKAGIYTYFCTIPGHAPGGMYGTLIVR